MSDIFRAATKVLIWLGEASDNSDMAFEALASVHGNLGLLHGMAKSWHGAGLDVSKYMSNQMETALVSVCNRAYWSRVWIIQEILSASSVDVLCGSKVLVWEEFRTGLNCISNIRVDLWGAGRFCESTPA